MSNYEQLSPELNERIRQDKENGTRPQFAARSADAVRRDPDLDREAVWRTAYVRDVDKILHSPFYNRYTDKTQVFSFYKTTISPAAHSTCSSSRALRVRSARC